MRDGSGGKTLERTGDEHDLRGMSAKVFKS
jgi:hypothetical protein